MSKPLVIIDPGHGGKDPGGGTNAYWQEKKMNLDMSLYQYERFQELGVSVALTRDSDITLTAGTRTQIVRESGARICLSNHINAGGGEGAEVIHSIHRSNKFAKLILDEIVKAGQKGRRVYARVSSYDQKRDYYYMHRETGSAETVIIEYGFADHEKDAQRLLNNWQNYGEAVVKAVCSYINHPYSEQPLTDQWKYEGLHYLYENGLLTDYEAWKKKIDEPMPVWAAATLLRKVYESLTMKIENKS
ncbi:MAG: N-acetylmuramoyl-L-alanine amidase family protein [Bacillota bacterium]